MLPRRWQGVWWALVVAVVLGVPASHQQQAEAQSQAEGKRHACTTPSWRRALSSRRESRGVVERCSTAILASTPCCDGVTAKDSDGRRRGRRGRRRALALQVAGHCVDAA